MQPQEQVSAPSAAFSWIAVELSSILQLFFFLTLGYTVTRTWIWSKTRSRKAFAKKVDDVDSVIDEIQAASCSESDATPSAKKSSARGSNARERKNKKARKEDQTSKETESVVPEPAPVLLEELPEQCLEQSPPEAMQCEPEAQVESSPEAAPAFTEESAAETPAPAPVSERVAKMMAKKMERKAKKAFEKEKGEEEEACKQTQGVDVEQPDKEPEVVALVEEKSDAEAVADDMAQALPTPSVMETPNDIEITSAAPQEIIETQVQDNVVDCSPVMEKIIPSEDNVDTDAQLDNEEVKGTQLEGIETPEQCLSLQGLNMEPMPEPMPEPMLWCGAGVPQMEGWVAVAVPAEYAPAGAPGPFDGLWTNKDDERIVVEHEEVFFESGMKWVMEMQSLTELSVKVGEEVFTAELDPAAQRLVWSDGDVWTCVGQTDGQQRWAEARSAEGMPPILLDGEISPLMSCPMLTLPQNQFVPEEVKSWEVCWDWSKKGWCPRGDACEWYHPCQQAFQGACEPCNSAAPFGHAPFADAPFAGF